MYFLSQIKTQYFNIFANNFQPSRASEAPVWDSPSEQELAANAVWLENNYDNLSTSELLEELKERLDILKSAESIVGPEAQVLIRFCNKVKSGEVKGLWPEDEDFVRLSNIALRKVKEYQGLAKEGHDIQGDIQLELQRLGWEVQEELKQEQSEAIENTSGDTLTPEQKKALWEEVEKLLTTHQEISERIQERIIKTAWAYEDQNLEVREMFTDLADLRWQPSPELSLEEKKQEFENKISNLLELEFTLPKTLRDEKIVWENGESLWETRKSLVETEFVKIKDSGTEVQKKIVGEKLWYSETEKEMLSHDDIWALAKNWVNLSTFLLVDTKWKAFDGIFKNDSEFVFSSGWRDDIDGYLISHILDFQHIESVNIWWVDYKRDANKWFINSDGKILNNLRDWELIKISKTKTLSEEDFKPFSNARDSSYYQDRTSRLISDAHDDFQESGINGFKWSEFVNAILSGDISALADQLEHFMEWRFHVDKESWEVHAIDPATWEQIPYDISKADMSLESLSTFPWKYKKNLIASARKWWISPDALVSHMNSECEKYGFPPSRFVVLIGKESSWKNWAASPYSSAKWFSQMLDGTWKNFWVWNRSNPKDQLSASLKYLNHIMRVRKCSPEDACAFYNTWEYFKINNSAVNRKVASWNSVIVNKIPWGLRANWITQREYFIWAVAYYNELSYADAKSKSSFA